MRTLLCLLVVSCFALALQAQELFPNAEPASNVPRGALGVRLFDEGYPEANIYRNLTGLKLMYGATPKLSVYLTATVSDYHQKNLPFDFITHNHGGSGVSDSTLTPVRGVPYSYVFNSADLYAKYRFYSADGANTHLRLAAYGEASYVAVPSHEAEPDLLVHTSGFAGGLIATGLYRHFAASLTTGFILPIAYTGNTYDYYGGVYPVTVRYGNGVNYDLSLGYLLFPRSYKSYKQTSWSIYCEFEGKTYGEAEVWQQYGIFAGAQRIRLPITTPLLKAGSFVDASPGLQCIINSTYRIDASVTFPLVSESYDHLYPLYLIGVQRYFYFKKRAVN